MPRPSPQTERVVAIARLLAAHPDEGFTITEIARRLRLNKATFYPMLIALTEAGWLGRDPATKEYRLGPELITLGEAAGRSLPAVQLARPAMVRLATELGVTCAAFTAAEGVATLADQVWDVRSTVQPLRVGLWAPLRAPFGAVFAAWADEAHREAWLEGSPDRAGQAAALDAIRRRGYVVERRTDTGELSGGTGSLVGMLAASDDFLLGDIEPAESYAVSTIEAPVIDADDRVVLGLVLVGLPRTMTGAEVMEMATKLLVATKELSHGLHGQPR